MSLHESSDKGYVARSLTTAPLFMFSVNLYSHSTVQLLSKVYFTRAASSPARLLSV